MSNDTRILLPGERDPEKIPEVIRSTAIGAAVLMTLIVFADIRSQVEQGLNTGTEPSTEQTEPTTTKSFSPPDLGELNATTTATQSAYLLAQQDLLLAANTHYTPPRD